MTIPRNSQRGQTAFSLRFALTALALTLGACSAVNDKSTRAADGKHTATTTFWEYPASAFAAMCIVLQPDGKLAFKGGFLFFNPGSWRIEPVSGHIELTLGGTAPFPDVSAREEVRAPGSRLVKFNGPARKLEYRIDSTTDSIGFGGFVFYKKTSCSAV